MYKFYYDFLSGQWNVYFTHEGKDDFQCSFATVQEASDYCDEKNMSLLKVGE